MVMISKQDDSYVLSPSDLTTSASCEFAWMRAVDVKLGRVDRTDAKIDAMLARTATLGLAHEARELNRLVAIHGDGVVRMPDLIPYDRATLAAAHAQTVDHLRAGSDVVFQAAFFDGSFGGLADFIVKDGDGRYEVRDTKLARHAKVSALLQIAAYAHQLDLAGIPRSPVGKLVLGDGSTFEQDLTEIIPVYLARRAKLESMLVEHIAELDAVQWNDPRYSICGSCDTCAAEIEIHRDLLLVAGMRKTQRAKLRAASIETIEDLATSTGQIESLSPNILSALRAQATLQIAPHDVIDGREVPAFQLIGDGRAIRNLPSPSTGDIFFDFEGDPLWSDSTATVWGLEYLFGVIEPVGDGEFKAWWAHDRHQEREALIGFLDYVAARRAADPGMHVYHYAPYEVTALKRLVGRHGTHEDVLDDLLRHGVFVDLYQTVRQGIRAGTRSYSIKKLEPLYMGDELRTGLDNAADSIVWYQKYTDELADADPAAEVTLREIADYNRYDCLSTWRLRDWLLRQIDATPTSAMTPSPSSVDRRDAKDSTATSIDEISPVIEKLLAHSGDPEDRTPDQQAAAMLAAAVGFHRREHKPFWWAFFDRLTSWPGEWLEPRDCFHAARVEVVEEWEQVGRKANARTLRLVGRLEPASNLTAGTDVTGIYDDVPEGLSPPQEGGRCTGGGATIVEVDTTSDGLDVLIVREKVKSGIDAWHELPMGLCTPSPVPTAGIEETLLNLARSIADELPWWRPSAGFDILRRVPPRLTTGSLGGAGVPPIDAIHDSLVALDRSYLAVQGPPGTGKTYVGSRVIKRLVDAGWRIGVVAQSHAVVENFLTAAVAAGVSSALIAKPRSPKDAPWSDLNGDKLQDFIDGSSQGCLVGGTAWTFSSRKSVGAEQLDLLVVDEAGQFSLANTLAVSTAAQRMLLLGDPQQLPQVSQGTHPEPVDLSALEWIADGHETMPIDRGYFLERTWRMHSGLTESVSRLSYAGRLLSEVGTTDVRDLTGVEPGVHVVTIDHAGNDVQSVEEAATVVDLVRSLQRQTWRPAADATLRPVTPADVLVVAPYNAQGALLRRELAAAGFDQTRVGTVDKFQGQEAPVVIVSMTASSADDVPRGMEFLLNRNRLNVAISRGQWVAYVVRSTTLTDFVPSTPAGLEELGAFLHLANARV